MKINYNGKEVGKWYHNDAVIPKAYINDNMVFPRMPDSAPPTPEYDVMCSGSISDYTGNAPEVYCFSTNKWYMRTIGGNYTEYGIYATGKPQDPYIGELAMDSGHEWEYTSNGWVDLGEVQSGGSLPVNVFSLNYNAKHMDGNTFLREEGQLVDADATINGSNYTINDGYVTIGNTNAGTTYCAVGGFQTYMNRNNSNPEITIISKAKTNPAYNNHYSLLCNRGSNYNWMWRPYRNKLCLHGGSGEQGNLSIPQGEVVIGSARVNSSRQLILNDWSNGTTNTTNSFSYGSLENGGFAMFRDYYNSTSEPWSGDFYWVFMCQSTLTDEEVQQVIQYNEEGGIEYIKEYTALADPEPIGTTYTTAADEYLKVNDNYYKKDYIAYEYQCGAYLQSTDYVQGDQLTPIYVQGEASDFIVYDGGRYYKNYIYVTPVSTPIATGDYVRGEYIGPADIIISGVTKSSSNFTVKINNTDTTANIISTSGSNYNYAVYGSFNDSISISGLVKANTNIITCNVITSGVTSVNGNAFRGCTSLENVTLPDSITSIDGYSFTGCRSLKSFVVPSGVTSLSNEVFSSCSALTSVTFHNNFRGLGYMVFGFCKNLTSITLPDSLTSIGESVFYGAGLTSIHIPASVTSIYSNAFENCSGITSMTVDANNTTFDSRDNCNAIIKKSNNQLNNGCMNTVIPSTVTSIASRAFSGHMNLAIITIPSGVTEIGSYAFYNCRNTLFHIESTTPATLSSYAFDNGYGYILVPVGTSATYKGATNWSRYASRIYDEGYDFSTAPVKGTATSGEIYVKFNADMSTKYYCAITSVNQDDTVNFVWSGSTTVTKIGSGSMSSDYKMSQNILTVDFRNLPSTCTGVADESFYGYPYKEIYLPSSITSVGKRAFQYYGGKVHFTSSTPPTINSNSFYDAYCIIYVPVGTAETYKAASNWTQYSGMIFEEGTDFSTMPVTGTATGGTVTMRFGSSDMRGSYYDGDKFFIDAPLTATTVGGVEATKNITTIDLSRMTNVTSIGNYTFSENHSLTTAKLPDSLKSIKNSGFYDCTALQSITIPSGVTSIGFGAFFNDGNSNTVYIFEPVTPPTIDTYAFWQAKGTIYVPDESLTAYKTATNWSQWASKIKPISELPSE